MNQEMEETYNKRFEEIKHTDVNGLEFWYARELQIVLDYKEWRKFENVINKAKESCENSNISAFEHFVGALVHFFPVLINIVRTPDVHILGNCQIRTQGDLLINGAYSHVLRILR